MLAQNQCQNHSNNDYQFICQSFHKCQRKLCVECLKIHQIEYPNLQFISLDKFFEHLNISFSNLEDQTSLITNFDEMKQEVLKVKQLYKELFQKMVKCIDQLFQNIKDRTTYYLELKSLIKQQNIEIFTKGQLDTLVSDSLAEQIKSCINLKETQIHSISEKLQQCLISLREQHLQMNLKIEQQNVIDYQQDIFQGFQIDRENIGELKLIGNKIFDMMEGKYQYIICLKDKCTEIREAGYYQLNHRQGFWQLIDNNIMYKGYYVDGLKVGKWISTINDSFMSYIFQVSAECVYNQNGEKNGKWCEITMNSYDEKQIIIEQGNYQNGLKVGKWEILYCNQLADVFNYIGGGKYNENGVKVGQWKEINLRQFNLNSQLVWKGYYAAGLRVGKWKLQKNNDFPIDEPGIQNEDESENLGGGQYNEKGQKFGLWKDINEEQYNDQAAILWQGQYQNGHKFGKWKILFSEEECEYIEIGGGQFDQSGRKIGKWKDIDQNQFTEFAQLIWQGQYQEDLKKGIWKGQFFESENSIKIGGTYDDQGQKVGWWVELDTKNDKENQQIFFWEGQYQAGVRIGDWKEFVCEGKQNQIIKIGGGQYDQCGLKIGEWREIQNSFYSRDNHILWIGNYKAGVKVGEWKLMINNTSEPNKNSYLGNGYYDENGKKVGVWNEFCLIQESEDACIIQKGLYQADVKIGEWNIIYSEDFINFQQIGGGCYSQNGLKIGTWTDVNLNYYNVNKLIIWKGTYEEGVRIGIWKVLFRGESKSDFLVIAGGKYDQNGWKIGYWREINEKFYNCENNIIWIGNYSSDHKIGKWKVLLNTKQFSGKEIGGGGYDNNGQKTGKWKDIKYNDDYYQIVDIFY